MLTRIYYELYCLERRAAFVFLYPFLRRKRRKAYKFRTRMIENILRADTVILSYPKSGRTWVEVMLSHLFQKRLGLPVNRIVEFSNAYETNPALPHLFFTHDDAHVLDGNIFFREGGGKGYFLRAKTVLIVRHPLDVAVSMYFQQSKRSRHVEGVELFDFVMHYRSGLPSIIRFMNRWVEILPRLPRHHMLRYEDLRAHTYDRFKELIDFLGFDFTQAEIREAIAFCAFERMQEKEKEDFFSDPRVQTDDPADPDSYKVRRGVVGGYKDYFTEEQSAELLAMVRGRLDPSYAYSEALGGQDSAIEARRSSSLSKTAAQRSMRRE